MDFMEFASLLLVGKKALTDENWIPDTEPAPEQATRLDKVFQQGAQNENSTTNQQPE